MSAVVNQALRGSLVVLSGPTSGLGRAMFDLLCARNAAIVAIGRQIHRLPSGAMATVEADFGNACDRGWAALTSRTLSALAQRLAPEQIVLIANAGTIAPIAPAEIISPDAFEQAIRINVAAPLLLAQTVAAAAAEAQASCRIINISTGAASRPIPGWLAYCTGKAACKMAFDGLAQENPAIVVDHVDPGVVDTGMQAYIRGHDAVAGSPVIPQQSLQSSAVAADRVLRQIWATT